MLFLLACAGSADDSGSPPTPVDYFSGGFHAPGRHTEILEDVARNRTLPMEVWYPTIRATGSHAITEFVDPTEQATYQALLDAAPVGCPTRFTVATPDATPDPGPLPLIGLSHCHGCTRFSMVSVAEHLASFGFVVVAPDHVGNTLFDELAGTGLPLDTDTLLLREGDLTFAMAAALDGSLGIDLAVDRARTGVMGHSFGAITAGRVAQVETEVRAAMFIGAPPENPLLPGVTVAELDAPLLFELLAEDHSVGAAGNTLIEANFAAAEVPAWLLTVADAGHWSPSDLVGLTEDFMPGCGEDTRQGSGEAFTYMDPALGRATTGAYAAAFFDLHLNGVAAAEVWLEEARAGTTVEVR